MQRPLQEFIDSLGGADVPTGHPALLQSVWYGLKGQWVRAHEIAQDQAGADAAWVHAWLHRIEGDLGNADYWYRRAKRASQTGDTLAEGTAIAATLLAR